MNRQTVSNTPYPDLNLLVETFGGKKKEKHCWLMSVIWFSFSHTDGCFSMYKNHLTYKYARENKLISVHVFLKDKRILFQFALIKDALF